MKIRVIGDVHGRIPAYLEKTTVASDPDYIPDVSIQLGDMGLGFPGVKLPVMENHKFFRGNHDDPSVCREHPNYLGDFGVYKGILFCGGADSIDKHMRTIGKSWWPDEQLSQEQFDEAMELYRETKPNVVITHDAPNDIAKLICDEHGMPGLGFTPNRTTVNLQSMLDSHRPQLWIFGHWHATWTCEYGPTTFVCLNELQTMQFEGEDSDE